MTTTQYLTKKQFSAYKARLTRALNSKDPQTVINCVTDTFEDWDMEHYAYPDDWHRWERAREDAKMALAYGTPMR